MLEILTQQQFHRVDTYHLTIQHGGETGVTLKNPAAAAPVIRIEFTDGRLTDHTTPSVDDYANVRSWWNACNAVDLKIRELKTRYPSASPLN
jgi:hypothetical protein